MSDHTVVLNPSLLACDFMNLKDDVVRAVGAGADMLHADVMDGVYVPNISFGFDIIKSVINISRIPVDVHMMTCVPQNYFEKLAEIGAASVTIHSDIADKDSVISMLRRIRQLGMRSAVALKPAFAADDIIDMVEFCDMVLVMTVEPGFGGQKFMDNMLPKIEAVKDMIIKNNLDCDIQVDGGINEENAAKCAAVGANNFVVGTAFFGSADPAAAAAKIRSAAVCAKNNGL